MMNIKSFSRFYISPKALLYFSVWFMFAAVQVYYFIHIDTVRFFPDTGAYQKVAEIPVADSDFWAAIKPPVIPLVMKLSGDSLDRFIYIQVFISFFSWTILAISSASVAKSDKGRIILFTIPLLSSVMPLTAFWNFSALSESIAISLLVLLIAAFIALFNSKKWIWGIALAVISLPFAGVRDTNAYVLLMIAIVLLITAIRPKIDFRRRTLNSALGVFIFIVFLLAIYSHNNGNRWVFSFYNIISQRILTNSDYTRYFEKHGMPMNSALQQRAKKFAHEDDFAFFNAEKLHEFRQWTEKEGKHTYVKFLLEHPGIPY